jgi:hypothetical protein
MGEYEEESVPAVQSGDEAGEVTEESLASFESLEYESTNKISTKSNFNNVIRIYVLWCKEIPESIIGSVQEYIQSSSSQMGEYEEDSTVWR